MSDTRNASGILFTDGISILLLKRSEGDNKGKWGLPGGHLKDGETEIDAAIRESKEECGKVDGYRIAKFEEKNGIRKWTTFIFRIEKPFKAKLSKEHSEWKWFRIKDLKKQSDLHPKFKENLDTYVKFLSKKLKTFREWIADKIDSLIY